MYFALKILRVDKTDLISSVCMRGYCGVFVSFAHAKKDSSRYESLGLHKSNLKKFVCFFMIKLQESSVQFR